MHAWTIGLEPLREPGNRAIYSAPAAVGSKSADAMTESGGSVTVINRVSPTSGRMLSRSVAGFCPSHGTDGSGAVPQIRAGSKPGTDSNGVDGIGLSMPMMDFPFWFAVTIKRAISRLSFIGDIDFRNSPSTLAIDHV
jgi:hypothetical protein